MKLTSSTGAGEEEDVTQVDGKICRSNPKGPFFFLGKERECIFPFYLDGKRIDSCLQYEVGGLNFPVFTCPSYNITTKFEDTGINSFNSEDFSELLVSGMCAVNPSDENSPVDPNLTCSPFVESGQRRLPFYQCKNNCPGGMYIKNLYDILFT